MITVNTGKLVEAVREADAFKVPDMNEGTSYLYEKLYMALSKGEDVRLLSLDFNAFEEEDVNSLNDLYTKVFEKNYYMAFGIASTLRGSRPVCKDVVYV
jgi:hypothetical protein